MNATLPPTLAPGTRHRVTIEDVAFGGQGVARIGGCAVFVPFAWLDEVVDVEITERKKQFARAIPVRIEQPSPHRVHPPCPHFGACGGCQYQHVAYPEQLRLKRRQVVELLRRIGGFPEPAVAPVVPSPHAYGYRNRLMLRSQWNRREQRLMVGFLRWDNRWVVDVESCAIAEPALNDQIRSVRAHPPPRGGLKVVVRVLPDDWEVPADSFFQNNPRLLPELVECVRRRLEDAATRHLLDVYCGVGFFGISLAGSVQNFAGVEYDAMAIRAARRNAARHGVVNGEFLAGEAETCLPELLRRFPADSTTVLLDPPRVGCRPQAVAQLRSVQPRQILYVSCHPATLARDLNAFCRDGVYQLVQLTPLDMFPQTQHVECVADLRLSPTPHRAV
ncbi:MAG TPA: class I SAM-dependent RNA methyltransferase [Verrucomicrobiota bacterium]|nr:class I SAM-dependent RNA methyltransferase [Verrucomicrobiota bacterium]HNU51285.1 class I SAM-dependent RNA methyltransferase [Verrucomicrobiota bacterium]